MPRKGTTSKKRKINQISTSMDSAAVPDATVHAVQEEVGIEDVIPSDLSEESLNAANTSAMMVENQLCSTTRKNYERVSRYIVKFFQEKKIFAALDQTQSSLIFPMNKQHLIVFKMYIDLLFLNGTLQLVKQLNIVLI
jgi:hypothetical protein